MDSQLGLPDSQGHYGLYGGKFVPETLMPALTELESAYAQACGDAIFWQQFDSLCRNYVGRPTPLYHARKLSERAGPGLPGVHASIGSLLSRSMDP